MKLMTILMLLSFASAVIAGAVVGDFIVSAVGLTGFCGFINGVATGVTMEKEQHS